MKLNVEPKGPLIKAFYQKYELKEINVKKTVYSLSWEIIHLQDVPAVSSGSTALVGVLNKASNESGDNLWQYRKAANQTYECTLWTVNEWKNIGNSKSMWNKNSTGLKNSDKEVIKKHMQKAETIALTIEL